MKKIKENSFTNKPNRRKLKSNISETVIATCVVLVRRILSFFGPIY